ncbi:MAG: hypothetical protein DMD70_08485 [Gemmatimonadetes bacterium]|nr:MAG: hypothetical protein DMD70_08485 [Gemmatimonadota bacterium]
MAAHQVRARNPPAARPVPGDLRARRRGQSRAPGRGGDGSGWHPISGSVGARHLPVDAHGAPARASGLLGVHAHQTALGIRPVGRADRALAFTLAAIVAAVRFRNTLKDTKDAVYIFLALAVGVAAGVFSPTVAAVMSLMFNIVVLALWELNVGNIYADQRGRMPALPPAEGLLGPRRRSSAALAVGDPDLLAALAPHELEEVADRAARLQAYVMARAGDKKEDRFNGMLLVHTTQPEAAQRVVEELLEVQARRWRLAEIVPAEQGRSSLEYLLRLRNEFLPTTLLDALKGHGTPPIDAAEYRSLRGLKKRKEE